ncbi:H/ACA ribonucleoprotein complex subunit 4 [Nematocida sp. AWRm80]|nr:H/ACA ribonucleoprotein complex subunit 4 [Nematocida sp. AWRm80]
MLSDKETVTSKHSETEHKENTSLETEIHKILTTDNSINKTSGEKWPLLLKGLENMHILCTKYTPTENGYSPMERPLKEYLKYGIINLDKPCNPSSHEVVSWVKSILKCSKTGHAGTLDPMVSGCLPVTLNRATRIAKCQQNAGKEYVGVVKFSGKVTKEQFKEVLSKYVGQLLQRPPEQCAVKRILRIREIYTLKYLDFDEEKQLGMFRASCEAGTYIRSLCMHLGLSLGVEASMVDLRRTRSGNVTENNLVTMHDVLDSAYQYNQTRDEKYLRTVVQPLEVLLKGYPRIIIKDSSVNSVCYGAQITTKGILRYDDFNHRDLVVLVSPKGEAVALAVALVTAPQLSMMEHGQVCRTKRVIMDKDTYDRQWKLGPKAGFQEPPKDTTDKPESKEPSTEEKSHERKDKKEKRHKSSSDRSERKRQKHSEQ